MRRRPCSGTTTAEFALVAPPLFLILLGLLDLGRYGMVTASLGNLASATSRAVIIGCYAQAVARNQSPATCGDPLSDAEKRLIAPGLYLGGAAPTVTVGANGSALVVQASQSFRPLLPLWGSRLDRPSQSVTLPF
jgi:hypothetical protein